MVLYTNWISWQQVESIYTYPQTTKLQHKKKTMDNEKPKRIRTAHIAFVQKTMEGAKGILVKPITWKIHQGKTYGIEIYREQKPGNYPKTGWNNSGKHYVESAIMQFSLYGSLWLQWCRKRLGCRILDLVDTQKKVQCSENKYRCSPTNSISIKQKETTRILQPGDLMLLQQKQRNETL